MWYNRTKHHDTEESQSTQIFGTGNSECNYPDTHKTDMSTTAFTGWVGGPVLRAVASLRQQQMESESRVMEAPHHNMCRASYAYNKAVLKTPGVFKKTC